MTLFTSAKKKLAREMAHKLASGHITLLAYWTLKHAGVLDAIHKQQEGLDPVAYARQSSLSEDTLLAALHYLAQQDFVIFQKDRVFLTPACLALLEHGDGVLEHLRAYNGVTHMLEHLLAGLKTYGNGVSRKSDVVWQAQSQRFAEEVYPAIEQAALKHGLTHILDLGCGGGTLLVRLAQSDANIVGLGVCEDGILVRHANAAITAAGLEKRLIAVTANAIEICTTTQRALDRISVSQQLWEKFDGLIACGVFTDVAAKDPQALINALQRIPENFRSPLVLLAEPCAGPRLSKTFCAPEMELLNRISHTMPATQEQWRSYIGQGNLKIIREVPLETDGVTLFVCKG